MKRQTTCITSAIFHQESDIKGGSYMMRNCQEGKQLDKEREKAIYLFSSLFRG